MADENKKVIVEGQKLSVTSDFAQITLRDVILDIPLDLFIYYGINYGIGYGYRL